MLVALLVAGCNSDMPTRSSPASVDSLLQVIPPPFVGTPPVDYSGIWIGESRGEGCVAVITPCRVNVTPASVRLEFIQRGNELTGFSQTTPLTGYVTASLGVFVQTAFGKISLERLNDGFTGLSVGDTIQNGMIVRSESRRIPFLRRE